MAAVLIWVEKNVSRTDVECAWKRAKTPSTDQIAAKRVSEMTPSTTQGRQRLGASKPVPAWTFNWIGWILSPETPRTLPIKTFEGLVTNPDYAEAEDKALHLLSSFVVTNREKQQIERATVGMHYGQHIGKKGSQQATLVWCWQQSSGSPTLHPYLKHCLASTTSNKDRK
ncbi:unnamed protein product [Boreogadus saida]